MMFHAIQNIDPVTKALLTPARSIMYAAPPAMSRMRDIHWSIKGSTGKLSSLVDK